MNLGTVDVARPIMDARITAWKMMANQGSYEWEATAVQCAARAFVYGEWTNHNYWYWTFRARDAAGLIIDVGRDLDDARRSR